MALIRASKFGWPRVSARDRYLGADLPAARGRDAEVAVLIPYRP